MCVTDTDSNVHLAVYGNFGIRGSEWVYVVKSNASNQGTVAVWSGYCCDIVGVRRARGCRARFRNNQVFLCFCSISMIW